MKKFFLFVLCVTASFVMSDMCAQNNKVKADVRGGERQSLHNGVLCRYKTERTSSYQLDYMINELEYPVGISPNGNNVAIMTMTGGDYGWLWTEGAEIQMLEGIVYDVSDDGIVCGSYTNEDDVVVGGYWQDGEWHYIGDHPNYPNVSDFEYNGLWCMNSDATIFGGIQFVNEWQAKPFTWTIEGGFVDLPTMGGSGRPNSMSDDGTIIGGWVENSDGFWLPCIWNNGEMNILSETISGEVYGVSRNGAYATGIYEEGMGDAFVWDVNNGIRVINNTLCGGNPYAMATGVAVSNNGRVFGYVNSSFPPFVDTRVAFVTDDNGDMISFADYAVSRGWEEAASWTFCHVADITPDESTIIGAGMDPDGNAVSFRLKFLGDAPTYTLELLASPEEGGTVNGAGQYQAGDEVSLNAEANNGFVFNCWVDNAGDTLSYESSWVYTMPEGNVVITACFVSPVSLSEQSEKKMILYPNPLEDRLFVHGEVRSVMIYDAKGIMLLKVTTNVVDTQVLKPGIYFVCVEKEDGSQINTKVVKAMR